MENVKKHTTRIKIKFNRESREKEGKIKGYIDITKIDKFIYAKEGIRLIDAIAGKCPDIALKLVEIILSISDK